MTDDRGRDRRPRPPSAPRHRETTAVLGMTIFIASWAMLFASLFFAYALTRLRAPFWPPLDLPRAAAGPARAPATLQLLLATRGAGRGRHSSTAGGRDR